MGMSFRKSMKIGGMRVNLSKSGIGVSTGIKGLRVGVNAKGKSYVSAGTHGMYYRKTLGSSEKRWNFSDTTISPNNSSSSGCFLWAVGIICCLIGFAFPIWFVVPGIMIVIYLLHKFASSAMIKMIAGFIDKINRAIDMEDFDTLIVIMNEVQNKISDTDRALPIYEKTYRHFLEKALENRALSDIEEQIIELYESKVSSSKMEEINSDIIDEIIADIISDGRVTDDESDYLDKIISVLSVNETKRKEIDTLIEETKKIDSIRKNGLKSIDFHNEVTDGKECYYKNKVDILKIRQTKGEQYYEKDTIADMYISKEMIDLVADGHKKIKINDIITAELKNGVIELVVINRQKPICLRSSEPSLIIAIIGEVKKKNC